VEGGRSRAVAGGHGRARAGQHQAARGGEGGGQTPLPRRGRTGVAGLAGADEAGAGLGAGELALRVAGAGADVTRVWGERQGGGVGRQASTRDWAGWGGRGASGAWRRDPLADPPLIALTSRHRGRAADVGGVVFARGALFGRAAGGGQGGRGGGGAGAFKRWIGGQGARVHMGEGGGQEGEQACVSLAQRPSAPSYRRRSRPGCDCGRRGTLAGRGGA
jgi:hypothetical protein